MTSYLPIYYKKNSKNITFYRNGNINNNNITKKKNISENISNLKEKKNIKQKLFFKEKQENNSNNKSNKIIQIQNSFIQKYTTRQSNILKECKKLKKIDSFKENYSSDYVILLENYIVKKKLPENMLGVFYFNNEIRSLWRLRNYNHFPKIISSNRQKLSIYMTYCGEKINYKNIPDNWLDQYNQIKETLSNLQLTSGDMMKKNICVLDNTIYIIDFGLNSNFSENYKTSLKKLYKILLSLSNRKKNDYRFPKN